MGAKSIIIALVVLAAIVAILYWAYDTCKLNKILTLKYQKTCSGGGGFVGAMAQHPELVPCAFPAGGNWHMNRCNYV